MAGCASQTLQTDQLVSSRPQTLPVRHLIAAVPFHPQQQYQCGPAALAMALNFSGVAVLPDELVPRVYVPAREGSFQVEMLAASRAYQRLSLPIQPDLESLLTWVAAGHPVLVLQNLGLSWYEKWHYAVVIGYDLESGKITLHSGETDFYTVSLKVFERTWRRGEYWGMVTLKPGQLPVAQDAATYFQALAAFERAAGAQQTEKAWLAGVDRWPDSLPLLMGYGNFLYNRQYYPAAADQYRRVTQLNPDYAPAFNNLAAALVKTGARELAITAATRAVEIDPDNAARYEQTLHDARALKGKAAP